MIYIEEGAGDNVPEVQATQSSSSNTMKVFRDKIAKEMWEDYCSYIGREI